MELEQHRIVHESILKGKDLVMQKLRYALSTSTISSYTSTISSYTSTSSSSSSFSFSSSCLVFALLCHSIAVQQ